MEYKMITLKRLINPIAYFQEQQPTKKQEPLKSHIYLDRIKYLKQEHIKEVNTLKAKIRELEDRCEILSSVNFDKARKIVKEEYDKKRSEKDLNRNTLANIKYLKSNTLEYILGHHSETNRLIKQNISDEPHVLISGKTGSGKSVTLFNILISICSINTPKSLEISLIDPKILSFGDSRIDKNPFLKEEPSIFDNIQAHKILKDAFDDMMKKYHLMRKKGVKDYRAIGIKPHVIFIDEVFELLEGEKSKEILGYITRIASLGRASGVHLVMATQSPRAKILSGTLKANLNFISHKTSNPIESKLVELPKAHELKGKGDGLRVLQNESNITRFQACLIDINSDETYACFNQNHPNQAHRQKQTQTTTKTDPNHSTQTTGVSPEKQAIIALSREIIETVDEKGKIKPKSYFIDTKKRTDRNRWDKAINLLHKEKEVIMFRNGLGYFLSVDYDIALSVIEND
jgi:ABC-type lipoprotein export system ATPase subunit